MVRMAKSSHPGPFIRMEIIEPMEMSVTDLARKREGDSQVQPMCQGPKPSRNRN
jgi:plasmid maintenance system antidote protein VapI